eukprot:COSAG04_NODE_2726_length_3673_cov_1.904589_1_plen_101_part_00
MLPRTAALGDMFRGDSVRISENLAFDQAIVRTQASHMYTEAAPLHSVHGCGDHELPNGLGLGHVMPSMALLTSRLFAANPLDRDDGQRGTTALCRWLTHH